MVSKQSGRSTDSRASRILKLTEQEQGIMKYHASSCFRNFQRDMAKMHSISQLLERVKPSQHCPVECTTKLEPRSKRFKPCTSVCIICGSDRTTVRRKTVHTLYRISEKAMAQKLLNVAMLFKDCVYTETAAMHDVGDVLQLISCTMIIVAKGILTNITPRSRK